MRRQGGFTSIEFLITLMMLVIMFLVFSVPAWNVWYTESGVLKKIQFEHPEVVSVLDSARHAFAYSVFHVKNEDGSQSVFELNSNLFYNYSVTKIR